MSPIPPRPENSHSSRPAVLYRPETREALSKDMQPSSWTRQWRILEMRHAVCSSMMKLIGGADQEEEPVVLP